MEGYTLSRARWHWFWMIDRWLLLPALLYLVAIVLYTGYASGRIGLTSEWHPGDIIGTRDRYGISDFSVRLDVRVIPDYPIAVEVWKSRDDESLRVFRPGR